MAPHDRQLIIQRVRLEHVVRAQDANELAARLVETSVEVAEQADVSLITQHTSARIGDLLQEVPCSIRGAVVDHEDLEVVTSLSEGGLDGPQRERLVPAMVDGDGDGTERRTIGHRPSLTRQCPSAIGAARTGARECWPFAS